MTVKKYRVYRHVNVIYRFYVEAENEEEAREKSEELYIKTGDSGEWDRDTSEVSVEEITQ